MHAQGFRRPAASPSGWGGAAGALCSEVPAGFHEGFNEGFDSVLRLQMSAAIPPAQVAVPIPQPQGFKAVDGYKIQFQPGRWAPRARCCP